MAQTTDQDPRTRIDRSARREDQAARQHHRPHQGRAEPRRRRERQAEGGNRRPEGARSTSAESAGAEVTTPARRARSDQEPRHGHAEAARRPESVMSCWPVGLMACWPDMPSPRSSTSRSTGRNTRSGPSWIPATSRSWRSSSRPAWPWRRAALPRATPSAWQS